MLYICSLINRIGQLIDPGRYEILRFPFDDENIDEWDMHNLKNDSEMNWSQDDRSGLIWPAMEGWATVTVKLEWERGNYTELRDQIVRDPLGSISVPDTTASEHRPPTLGINPYPKTYQIMVTPSIPLAARVAHNATRSCSLISAQFKVAIETNIAHRRT